MSQRQFAKRIGVSTQVVNEAIKHRRLTHGVGLIDGVPKIVDPLAAELQWRTFNAARVPPGPARDAAMARNVPLAAPPGPTLNDRMGELAVPPAFLPAPSGSFVTELQKAIGVTPPVAAAPVPLTSESGVDPSERTDPVLAGRVWDARTKRLKYERAAGLLVPAAEVERKVAERITACKTKLLGIPSRAKQGDSTLSVAQLAAIEGLIREALEDLAGPVMRRDRAELPEDGLEYSETRDTIWGQTPALATPVQDADTSSELDAPAPEVKP